MHILTKSLIGLVTTGTTAGVVWVALPDSSVDDYQILKAKVEKRNSNRVEVLKKVFVALNEGQRKEIVDIISSNNNALITIFAVNQEGTDFIDRDVVSNDLVSWCSNPTNVEKLKYGLNKESLCQD